MKPRTRSITFDLPMGLASNLDTANHELPSEIFRRGLRQLRIDQVLDSYARGEMSFGAAAEQAQVPRDELARHAYARGLEPPFSPETLAEELR